MSHPQIPPNNHGNSAFREVNGRSLFLIENCGNLIFVSIENQISGPCGKYWRYIIAAVAAQEWRDEADRIYDEWVNNGCKRPIDDVDQPWHKDHPHSKAFRNADAWTAWRDEKQADHG